MTRRCSHCSHNGHNSRTCPNRGVKLFGVHLTDGSIRKSASMGNLTQYTASNSSNNHNNCSNPGSPDETPEHGAAADGYVSEDFVPGSSNCGRERKKGVPWTEEEHKMFLLGLQKLGKGDWRGIARNYVVSRTPTQVASHAQKYFIRQSNLSRRKRRSSLFDIIADESIDTRLVASQELFPISNSQGETQSNNLLPTPPTVEEEHESMDSTNSNEGEATIPKPESFQCSYPVVFPAYFPPFVPFSFPFWPGYPMEGASKDTHEVVKPTAVHSKNPVIVDELVGMSKLSLGKCLGYSGPSSLSQKLLEGSTRQSAFHASPATGQVDMDTSSNPVHAV
ncbi:transcription factor MYBS3-like [Macadamia integrifolia]|uniref:transcription factor MYBS3-like n=1 Tax=Macadamia integrifolia TaxID=60698 RepID=UPI001C4F41EC|nr:transcription factor MYBS3-like [Macadamia integrifolia]